jgi:hypothetical protein
MLLALLVIGSISLFTSPSMCRFLPLFYFHEIYVDVLFAKKMSSFFVYLYYY